MVIFQPILMVGIQPPPEQYPDHSQTPGAWYLVYPTTKHDINDSGDKIIHAYVRLLSDTTPNIKQRLILIKLRTDHQSTIQIEGNTFPRLRQEEQFTIRDQAWKIGHYPVVWNYKVRDVVAFIPYKILSVFRNYINKPGAVPLIDIEISDSTLQPRGDGQKYKAHVVIIRCSLGLFGNDDTLKVIKSQVFYLFYFDNYLLTHKKIRWERI